MSVSYTETGRVHQKQRTRAALITAAEELLAEGRPATVEAAASRAAVSRATAYRYFPNQAALVLAAHPELEAESLLGPDPPGEAEARLDLAVDAIIETTLRNEPQLRAMLRLSLEQYRGPRDLVLRKGRRVIWMEDAMAPLRGRLPDLELRRLVHALAAVVGIDALVWMTDVAGMDREEAAETMRWSARALLRTALAGAA